MQFHAIAYGSRFYALPRLIALVVTHACYLAKSGEGIADMTRVSQGFLALGRKGELLCRHRVSLL
jgi:hypothetical protein